MEEHKHIYTWQCGSTDPILDYDLKSWFINKLGTLYTVILKASNDISREVKELATVVLTTPEVCDRLAMFPDFEVECSPNIVDGNFLYGKKGRFHFYCNLDEIDNYTDGKRKDFAIVGLPDSSSPYDKSKSSIYINIIDIDNIDVI